MLSHDSVWVGEKEGKIVGLVIAMYAHRCFLPLIVCMDKSLAVPSDLLILLRSAFRDVVRRGIHYYILDRDVIPEFYEVAKSRGAALVSPNGGWFGGKISDLLREKPRMSLRDAVKMGTKNAAC